MADANTERQCAHCNKTEASLGRPLKQCAKCRSSQYCDRSCQQSHWKQHKKDCRAAGSTQPTSTSTSSSNAAPAWKNLQWSPDKPFHRLNDKTWLHDRPETDVFKLLIDTYRLRLTDNYTFGDGGGASGETGFEQFLGQAEARDGLLPSWWSPEKQAACINLGKQGGWSDLSKKVDKSGIVERYGQPTAPMQLRLLGEKVIGTGPGGQKGDSVIRMQMMVESGEMYGSSLSMN